MVWYSHLFQNFPQFIVIHTAKGFGIVNKAEIDVFLEFSCFFHDPADVGNLISGSSAFSKTSLNIRKIHLLPKEKIKNLVTSIKVTLSKITNSHLNKGAVPWHVIIHRQYSMKWLTDAQNADLHHTQIT